MCVCVCVCVCGLGSCTGMVVDDVWPALQGFDAGEECYQEPPADGSGYNVDVDPNRSETGGLTA